MKKATEPTARKTIGLTVAMWARIAAYRHRRRIGAEAEAIRELIDRGLSAPDRKPVRGKTER